jgi:hypothetical protein
MDFSKEAESCRQEALRHLGKPEAPFLLRVARAFDDLDRSSERVQRDDVWFANASMNKADRS